jgi:hypothetical protein
MGISMASVCIMPLWINKNFLRVMTSIIKRMTGHDACGTWVVIKFIFSLPPTTMGVLVIFNDFIECDGGSSNPVCLSKHLCAKAMLRRKNIYVMAQSMHTSTLLIELKK